MKATPVEYQRVAKKKPDQELLVLRGRYRENFASLDPLEKEYLRIIEAEIQRRGLQTQVVLGQTLDRKAFITERLQKRNYPEHLTLDGNVTVRFVPTVDTFVLEADKEKVTRRLSDVADFKYLLDLIGAAKTVSWSEYKPVEEKKEKKEEKPPLEMPEEKLRATLLPYVEAARVKPLTEFLAPTPETGADRRLKMAKELQEQADKINTKIFAEIYSFKPLGRMTELGEALGAEPPKGKAVTTPLGTFVFAKNRMPDNQSVEKWHIQHAESERLSKASARYTSVFLKPRPNTVTGNFRVVEEGRFFREKGLLSPEEEQHLAQLEQFWASNPDLDREKGWGVYREGGKIELPSPTRELKPLGEREFKFRLWQEQRRLREAKTKERWTEKDKELMAMTFDEWLELEKRLEESESTNIKGYWGKSPRGLTAFWVEVYVNGERRIRGYEEVRQGTPESLAKRLQEKLRSDVEEAGLPVTALLTARTRLGEELLLNAPEDVLPKVRWKYSGTYLWTETEKLAEAKKYFEDKGIRTITRTEGNEVHLYYEKKPTYFKLTDTVFSQMESVIKDKARKQNEFDICQAETTFLAEVGHCGDTNARAIGRFITRPVLPEEMRNLAAKFEVTCVAESDKPSIQCFDPQSGQIIKEWKL